MSTKNPKEYKKHKLPIVLDEISETIFNNLPELDAIKFYKDIPVALGDDPKDLSLVHWKLLALELRELPAQERDIQAVIDLAITGMDLLAVGKQWKPSQISKAIKTLNKKRENFNDGSTSMYSLMAASNAVEAARLSILMQGNKTAKSASEAVTCVFYAKSVEVENRLINETHADHFEIMARDTFAISKRQASTFLKLLENPPVADGTQDDDMTSIDSELHSEWPQLSGIITVFAAALILAIMSFNWR